LDRRASSCGRAVESGSRERRGAPRWSACGGDQVATGEGIGAPIGSGGSCGWGVVGGLEEIDVGLELSLDGVEVDATAGVEGDDGVVLDDDAGSPFILPVSMRSLRCTTDGIHASARSSPSCTASDAAARSSPWSTCRTAAGSSFRPGCSIPLRATVTCWASHAPI
jgi:hypothetical protein